jgi:hypothetical protein
VFHDKHGRGSGSACSTRTAERGIPRAGARHGNDDGRRGKLGSRFVSITDRPEILSRSVTPAGAHEVTVRRLRNVGVDFEKRMIRHRRPGRCCPVTKNGYVDVVPSNESASDATPASFVTPKVTLGPVAISGGFFRTTGVRGLYPIRNLFVSYAATSWLNSG